MPDAIELVIVTPEKQLLREKVVEDVLGPPLRGPGPLALPGSVLQVERRVAL